MLHVAGPKTEGLSAFPLFRSLDSEALAALAQRCTQRRYRRDDWIVPLNEVNAEIFFIHSGACRWRNRPTGR